jgi:hypothetical protein
MWPEVRHNRATLQTIGNDMKAIGPMAVFAVVALTGCTTDQVNMATQAMGVYNATRAGGTSTGSGESVGAALGVATPTSTQTRKVASLMTVNTGNAAVNMVMPEVASTMTPFLLAVSCHRTTGNELPPLSARYIASNATGRFSGALNGMSRHPNDRCADVSQLSGWSRSGNTLAFTASFRSAQSGETQSRRYEMSKVSSGQWVFSAGN